MISQLHSVIALVVILMLAPTFIVAQVIPGEEDFTDIGPVGVTDEMQEASDLILDIAVGVEETDPLASVFDDVPIIGVGTGLNNGIIGEEIALWVGIQDDFYEDNHKRIELAIKDRFPNTPLFLYSTDAGTFHQNSNIVLSATPNSSIPDNTDMQGTTSTLSVTTGTTISTVSVYVNIEHTYRGDLKVDLVAPNGNVIVLHNREGGSEDNIINTYTTELSALIGIDARGTWTLRVGDYVNDDIGTLSSWRLTITPTTTPPITPTITTSPNTIFEDDFENGLSKWISTGTWRADRFDEGRIPPGLSNTNNVAESDDCDDPCTLTIASPIDLSSHTTASLQFWRYVDRSLDTGESLRLEVSTNGNTWTVLDTWSADAGDDDDMWHKQSYDISAYISPTFHMRFMAMMSSGSEDVGIDNVHIVPENLSFTTTPSCRNLPDESIPLDGGDKGILLTTDNEYKNCSTLTLGGLVVDGVSGFVISGHSAGPGNIDEIVVHGISDSDVATTPIGRVLVNPSTSRTGIVVADAAFAQYPFGCTFEFLGFCFAQGYQERLSALSIEGETRKYTVTSSSNVGPPDSIRMSGVISGDLDGTVLTNIMANRFTHPDGSSHIVPVQFVRTTVVPSGGDSGSPWYTVPNNNHQTKIVGIHTGSAPYNDQTVAAFSPWINVERHLGLDQIS